MAFSLTAPRTLPISLAGSYCCGCATETRPICCVPPHASMFAQSLGPLPDASAALPAGCGVLMKDAEPGASNEADVIGVAAALHCALPLFQVEAVFSVGRVVR